MVIIGIIIAILIGDILINIIAGGEEQKSKGKDNMNPSISRGVDGHRNNLNSAEQEFLNLGLLNAIIVEHNKEKAKSFILQGADVNTSYNVSCVTHGMTPLLCAIYFNDIEMVKLLLQLGANANKEAYINGRYVTALQYARGSGKQDIARLLEYS